MSFREYFKNRRASLLTPGDHSRKIGIVFFVLSVVVHALFFFGMVFFHDFKLPKPMPSVIQVDLVSFTPEPVLESPAQSQKSAKEEGIPVKTTAIKKKHRKIPTKKADISLKTKPKNLKELMAEKKKPPKKELEKKKEKKVVKKEDPKDEIDVEKKLEQAREELEKKVEGQNQNKIAEALSRLQEKVKEQGKSNKGDGKGEYSGYGKKGYKPIDLYHLVIKSSIEQNWVFNSTLARMDQDLEVIILVKILKSGEIRDIIYETRSGNRYLDESAKKSVMKINPLPPLPGSRRSYDIGLIFTPKGLK